MLSRSNVHDCTRATNNLRRVLFAHMADGRDNFSKGVSNLRTSVSVVFFVELGEFLQATISQVLSHSKIYCKYFKDMIYQSQVGSIPASTHNKRFFTRSFTLRDVLIKSIVKTFYRTKYAYVDDDIHNDDDEISSIFNF